MRALVLSLIFVMLVVAAVAVILNEQATNDGLPLVHASAPAHGFVCTPTITPRLGRVRTGVLA
jgi:hypothetical protein